MIKAIYKVINPSEQLVFFYRLYSWLYNTRITLPLSYLLYMIVRIVYSSDIHPASKIGKGLSIRHHFGIVIGKNAVIGNDVIIYNDVSIGQLNVDDSCMPVIGSNSIIYKGAVIVGNVTLPENTIISANKLVKPS
ncbi:hypothetical protein HKA89_20600 [Vibrio parahaemolyticus]|uniref:serine O-acetyltransferase n=1 Tax=Vibrio parahaemolyticus TaxID=670 RepID=UPI00146F3CC6|nr:hypothetical protein [Vibrio parahaemolyticus]MDF5279513.1 hypothetical protein [Vibrio parahaemolyticus]NMU71151.1 hypothetical protein [Vibrio parahaemolyticus]